jgi:hypothetical protein
MLTTRKLLMSIAVAATLGGVANADLVGLGGGAAAGGAGCLDGGLGGPVGLSLGSDSGAAGRAGLGGTIDGSAASEIAGRARADSQAAAAAGQVSVAEIDGLAFEAAQHGFGRRLPGCERRGNDGCGRRCRERRAAV